MVKMIQSAFELFRLCLVVIFTVSLTVTALSPLDNPCLHSGKNSLKTWGPTCQRMCRCRKNAACNSRGFCIGGCANGWTRHTSTGSCSFRNWQKVTTGANLVSNTGGNNNNNIYSKSNRNSNNNKNSKVNNSSNNRNSNSPRYDRDAVSQRNIPMYNFTQDDTCINDTDGVNTKLAHITAQPPILLKELAVVFTVNPRKDDSAKAMFKLTNFEKYSVTKELTNSPPDALNMLSIKNLEHLIADWITISIASAKRQECSPSVVRGYVVSGKPVCPYGKWGLLCQHNCQCPCALRECHPTSGRCLNTGLVCPPGRFGYLCSGTCSSECSGSPAECHAVTGECKECRQRNRSGAECETPVTLEQLRQRDAMCKHVRNASEAGDRQWYASRSSIDVAAAMSQVPKDGYRLAIIIFVFMILFLLLCCSYVQIVQHCAKRRMKEQLLDLEEARRRRSSMVTFTEFNKEFMEMQHGKAPNDLGRPRNESDITDQTVTLNNKGENPGGDRKTLDLEARNA